MKLRYAALLVGACFLSALSGAVVGLTLTAVAVIYYLPF